MAVARLPLFAGHGCQIWVAHRWCSAWSPSEVLYRLVELPSMRLKQPRPPTPGADQPSDTPTGQPAPGSAARPGRRPSRRCRPTAGRRRPATAGSRQRRRASAAPRPAPAGRAATQPPSAPRPDAEPGPEPAGEQPAAADGQPRPTQQRPGTRAARRAAAPVVAPRAGRQRRRRRQGEQASSPPSRPSAVDAVRVRTRTSTGPRRPRRQPCRQPSTTTGVERRPSLRRAAQPGLAFCRSASDVAGRRGRTSCPDRIAAGIGAGWPRCRPGRPCVEDAASPATKASVAVEP